VPVNSRAKRTLNKVDPHCIDAIFHTCWSSPASAPERPISAEEKQLSGDIDVGYYYLREKNYRAAESRLKEALELDPKSSAALLGLAQSEQKLGKTKEAVQHYEKYLALNPTGPDSEKVKKVLAQLR
jgi:Tfp pilus assembly protein PilF